jgi:hypothetical protein
MFECRQEGLRGTWQRSNIMRQFVSLIASPLNWARALLLAAACVLAIRSGQAEQVVFQLVGPNSLLAAPFVNAANAPMVAQDPGGASLTTTYSGTITVDVDNLTNPTSIEFINANAVAANSGNWLPEVGGGSVGDPQVEGDADPGTAMPANYGFVLDLRNLGIGILYSASRDTILSVGAAARPITAGKFDPFGIGVAVPQGTYDANTSSLPLGDDTDTDDIAGLTGTNCTDEAQSANRCGDLMGSYAVAGNLITLTLPLDFILAEGADPEVRFTGTFTATASLSQGLTGDYNADGKVDAADYVMWRGQNINGQQGYVDWRANFGKPDGSGAALGGAVPEPASTLLALCGLLYIGLRGRSGG